MTKPPEKKLVQYSTLEILLAAQKVKITASLLAKLRGKEAPCK